MKTTRTLRLLSLLGFLLLLAPFYDSCNGRRMKKIEATEAAAADTTVVEVDSLKIDTTEVSEIEMDTINNSVESDEPSILDKAYEFIDDDDSENAYEFAKVSFYNILEFNYNEFKTALKKDGHKVIFFELKNFTFILIIINTLLILFFSFKNHNRVYKLSKFNLILIFITVACLFLEGLFEDFIQIKWGYYAFLITNLLIFYHSKSNRIKT